MKNKLTNAQNSFRNKNYLEALDFYRQEIVENPDAIQAHLGIAKCLFMLKRPQDAIEKCKALQNLYPNSAMPYILMAEAYEEIKEDSNSIGAMETAYILEPNNQDVLASYGGLLLRKNKWKEGVQMLEQALALDPNQYYLYNDLAVAYGYQLDTERVLYCIKQMLRLQPTFKNYTRLGFAYLDHKRLSKPLILCLLFLIILFGLLHSWSLFFITVCIVILILTLGFYIKA